MFRDVAAVCFDLYGTLIRIRTDEEDLTRLWKPLCYFYAYQGAAYDSPEALRTAYRQAVEGRGSRRPPPLQPRPGWRSGWRRSSTASSAGRASRPRRR